MEKKRSLFLIFSIWREKTKQDLLRDGPLRLRLRLERPGVLLGRRGRRRRRLGGVVVGREAAPLGRAEG